MCWTERDVFHGRCGPLRLEDLVRAFIDRAVDAGAEAASASAAPPRGAAERDRRDVLEVHRRWLAAEESGDPGGVLALCSEDVAWLVPGEGLLRGKAAVRAWLARRPAATIGGIETGAPELELSGDLALKRCDFATSLRRSPGESAVVRGAHVWTLRRDPPRGWLVTTVCWSVAP